MGLDTEILTKILSGRFFHFVKLSFFSRILTSLSALFKTTVIQQRWDSDYINIAPKHSSYRMAFPLYECDEKVNSLTFSFTLHRKKNVHSIYAWFSHSETFWTVYEFFSNCYLGSQLLPGWAERSGWCQGLCAHENCRVSSGCAAPITINIL
jgi:hypothetical protein